MSGTSTADPLADARHLCRNHGLFIAEKTDRVFDRKRGTHRVVTVWIVYRKTGEGSRPVRLGKRRDPGELLRFVRKLI